MQPPSSTNPRGVNAMGPRNTQKQKSTAVISIDELDRIRRQVIETKDDNYETQRNLYRQSLQQTSKARVSNWSNTMEAQRFKREEDRIKKLEDAEVSKVQQLHRNTQREHYVVVSVVTLCLIV